MKRLIACAFVLSLNGAGPALATTMSFDPPVTIVQMGDVVMLDLWTVDMPLTVGMSGTFAYDPSVIRFHNVTAGNLFLNAPCSSYLAPWPQAGDSIRVDIVTLGCFTSGSNTIARLTFDALHDGTTEFRWQSGTVRDPLNHCGGDSFSCSTFVEIGHIYYNQSMPVRKKQTSIRKVTARLHLKRSYPTIRISHIRTILMSAFAVGVGSAFMLVTVSTNAEQSTNTRVTATTAVTALADITPPAAVSNLSALNSGLPSYTPPCDNFTLYALINTMSITASSLSVSADHATIRYRIVGAPDWTMGHNAVRTNQDQIVGSLFWLLPSTMYEVEMTQRTSVGQPLSVNVCRAMTQSETITSTTVNTWYVNASAALGGDGSLNAPFKTIQAGVNAAQPGDQVIVQAGVYHEKIAFPRSGTENAYIKVIGQPGAIMDGSDTRLETGMTWTPDPIHSNVYSTVLPADIIYPNNLAGEPIWRDADHFYTYDNLAGLQTGTGHLDTPIAEGWFYDPATRTLTIRSLTDPSAHTWHIRAFDFAFRILSRAYLWIEGLTIRYYPTAIYFASTSKSIFRNNVVQSENGVLIDNSQGTVSLGNRIENNYLFDTPVADWGYNAVKGTAMESGAIVIWRGTGTIIRDNRIEQFFNGIMTGDSADTDVYRNLIRHLGDDGLELDGLAANVRAWGNAVDDVLSSISVAPTTVGPIWAIYNRFTQFSGRAFKIGGGVNGYDFFYHNTLWSDIPGAFGTQQVTTDTNTLVFRNNILIGDPAIRWTQVMTGLSMDYDNAYSTNLVTPFYWNATHTSLSTLCSIEGQECHGSQANPLLVDPVNGSFGLQSGSPNIDTGVLIPGINHLHNGAGPDRGYLEFGQPEISW